MPSDLFGTLLILGAVQGFFLALLIFQKRRHLFANYFLSTFIFLTSLMLLDDFWLITDLASTFPYAYFILYIDFIPFFIFPLYYLYIRHLISPAETFNKKEWFHFLPVFILVLYSLPMYFKSHQILVDGFIKSMIFTLEWFILNGVLVLQGIVYLLLSFQLLKRYAVNIKQAVSSLEKTRLNWLQYIGCIITASLFLFIVEMSVIYFQRDYPGYLAGPSIAVSVYVMGYVGFLKSNIFSDPEVTASIRQLSQLSVTAPPSSKKASKKYKRSGLTDKSAREYLERLQRFMEDHKPYRNNELTLNQLAEMFHISPHYLSEIINVYLGKNFFEFINEYRLEEAIRDLCSAQKQHLTILAIAMQAGFNSKTTFNTFFKKQIRMSPFAYRKQMQVPQEKV